jgi:hypothetical protein
LDSKKTGSRKLLLQAKTSTSRRKATRYVFVFSAINYILFYQAASSESWIPVQDVAQLWDYENPELEEVGQYR